MCVRGELDIGTMTATQRHAKRVGGFDHHDFGVYAEYLGGVGHGDRMIARADAVTPRSRCSAVNRNRLSNAPRALKLPVLCSNSSFMNTRPGPEGFADRLALPFVDRGGDDAIAQQLPCRLNVFELQRRNGVGRSAVSDYVSSQVELPVFKR